jgi:hypothetical protein
VVAAQLLAAVVRHRQRLSQPGHVPYLSSRLETVELHEAEARLPYLPLIQAPYYRFIGRRPQA